MLARMHHKTMQWDEEKGVEKRNFSLAFNLTGPVAINSLKHGPFLITIIIFRLNSTAANIEYFLITTTAKVVAGLGSGAE